MRWNLVLASLASLAFAACVGGVDDGTPVDPTPVDPKPNPNPTPTDSAGKKAFDANVKTMVVAKCSGCHQGEATVTNAFLGPTPATTAYEAITKDRAVVGDFRATQATLLTKGAHAGVQWWSEAERTAITAWITQEATDRNIDQTTPPPPATNAKPTTSLAAMQQFAGCMAATESLNDWRNPAVYNMANSNTGQGQCKSCHNKGAGGFVADTIQNGDYMLQRTQEQLFFTGIFTTIAVPGTPVTYKVVANDTKLCAKGQERNNGTGFHPSYNCNNNNMVANLKTYVDKINAKLAAGPCGTPGFRPSAQ